MPIDTKNSFQHPSSLLYRGPFNPWDEYFYFEKEKEEEEEERKTKNDRRYRNMLFLCSKFCGMQYNLNNNNCYNNQPKSFPLDITSINKQQRTIPNQHCTINSNPQKSNPSSKIPYAIKFYKCKGCLKEMLFPIYNFKEIASIKEFYYESFCQLFHKIYPLANLGKLLKLLIILYYNKPSLRKYNYKNNYHL